MITTRVRGGSLALLDGAGQVVLEAHGEALLSDGTLLSTLRPGDGLEWQIDSPARRGDALSTANVGEPPQPLRAVYVVVRLRLRTDGRASAGLEQLRPLVVPHGYRHLPLDRLRIHQTGWQSWSRAHPAAPFEANVKTAAPPIRGPLMPHRRDDSQLEPWMTILVPDDGPALLLGFVEARHQLGTLEIIPSADGGHALIAATELDGVQLEPQWELLSEPLLVALGAPADLLEQYAQVVATEMDARPTNAVLTGWCSWYQLYADVTEADVDRNVASLAARRDLLPLRLIQLDDGFERAIGDWLDVLDTFPSGMPALAERIRGQGYMPGIWLAPFLLSARSRTYADHPEWVVRDERGGPLHAIDNWGSANYALDTTHPAALDWLQHVLRTVCDAWGFDYLKLDFVYAGAMRGRRYDRHATGVEAYRRGMQLLRDVAGERFILGCGAPLLPSVGIVDGMRIGSDVAADWAREANADGPSLRNAARATLARMWLHGRWWTNDPDCVVIRATDTRLTPAEVEGWASVVAMSGGMLFVGDDLSRARPDRLELLARLVPPSGQSARVLDPLVGLMPERLHLRVERAWAEWSIVGIANWSDAETTVWFDPADFNLATTSEYHVVDLWTGEYLGRQSSRADPGDTSRTADLGNTSRQAGLAGATRRLDLGRLAPHGVRLLSVHADFGRPQTIGSTGHLLGEAMDLAAETWDPASAVLRLTPATGGPPARRGEFIICDPAGPLRRVPFSAANTTPIHVRFGPTPSTSGKGSG